MLQVSVYVDQQILKVSHYWPSMRKKICWSFFFIDKPVIWNPSYINACLHLVIFSYFCIHRSRDLASCPHTGQLVWPCFVDRAYSRLAPSQRETALQSIAVSHWLGANLESALVELRCCQFICLAMYRGSGVVPMVIRKLFHAFNFDPEIRYCLVFLYRLANYMPNIFIFRLSISNFTRYMTPWYTAVIFFMQNPSDPFW